MKSLHCQIICLLVLITKIVGQIQSGFVIDVFMKNAQTCRAKFTWDQDRKTNKFYVKPGSNTGIQLSQGTLSSEQFVLAAGVNSIYLYSSVTNPFFILNLAKFAEGTIECTNNLFFYVSAKQLMNILIPNNPDVCPGASLSLLTQVKQNRCYQICKKLKSNFFSRSKSCTTLAQCSGLNQVKCRVIPRCGNGILQQGEQCDVLNTPGCINCILQPGFTCGEDSCDDECNDGVKSSLEQCDINYPTACINCIVQDGYTCSLQQCHPICGDNVKKIQQQCDSSPPGCINCKTQFGFTCTSLGCTDKCGDGMKSSLEQCDNGNRVGCRNCAVQSGYTCVGDNPSMCSRCGDGIKDPSEQCDNGNRAGCLRCVIDLNYNCFGNNYGTSICIRLPKCGNEILEQGEQCDNGNKIGCTQICKPDPGYTCTRQLNFPSVCTKCGNNIVELGQQCDNGNNLGCSFGCKIDPGYTCRGINSFCFKSAIKCGNNLIEIGEQCDDGNNIIRDGCNQRCFIEQGYQCFGNFGQRSFCFRRQ